MKLFHKIGVRVAAWFSAATCAPFLLCSTKGKGRTLTRRAAPKNLSPSTVYDTAASNSSSIVPSGSSRYCVTARVEKHRHRARQFVMAKPHFTEGQPSDFSRQRKVVGSFRATQVADLPARVIRAVAATSWSKHCMLGKMWVSSLSHLVGMRAVERAEL